MLELTVVTIFTLPWMHCCPQALAAQQAIELADAQAAAAEAAAARQAAAAAAAAAAEQEELQAKATLILTKLQPPVSDLLAHTVGSGDCMCAM